MAAGQKLASFLKNNATFFRVHFLCFVITAFIGSVILWGIGSVKGGHFSFVDCFFGITSALCLSGLTTLPVEDIPSGGQVVLMIMMVMGSQIFTSIVPLLVKKHRYCKVARIAIVVPDQESTAPPPVLERSFSRSEPAINQEDRQPSWSLAAVGRRSSQMLDKIGGSFKRISEDEAWMAEMSFKQEAAHLKDIFQEHQATIALIWIVVSYMVLVQLLGFFIAAVIILRGKPQARRIIRQKKINIGFFSLFAIVSAFCNVGYILSNENMLPYNNTVALLIDMVIVIFLGNAIYPPCLRGIIWLFHRFAKGSRKQTYEFLLNHPRKCYTHLFPPATTLWLLISAIGLNSFEVAVMYILDWNSAALQGLNPIQKIVNGIFQCANTRSGGMNSVDISILSPTTLFIFTVMMYISAYPVFLSRQYTRDRSGEDESTLANLPPHLQRDLLDTTLSTQFRRLLAQDIVYLFFGIFFICCTVNHGLKHDPLNYNIFTVIFEIISAYCGVGLTYGYKCSLKLEAGYCADEAVSFSGKWGVTGKIILIVVMLVGRHRGLPDNIDSAILLPEQKFSKIQDLLPRLEKLITRGNLSLLEFSDA